MRADLCSCQSPPQPWVVGGSVSCLFPAFLDSRPLLHPQSPLTSAPVLTSPATLTLLPVCYGVFVTALGLPESPGYSPHPKGLTLVTLAKSPLPGSITYSWSQKL